MVASRFSARQVNHDLTMDDEVKVLASVSAWVKEFTASGRELSLHELAVPLRLHSQVIDAINRARFFMRKPCPCPICEATRAIEAGCIIVIG